MRRLKTPVDVPYIVKVRKASAFAYKVGTANWYRWPSLTKSERSDILYGRKKETPMTTNAEPIWDKYLPSKQLPNTGHKKFKIGQVWAVCVGAPYIFRVVSAQGGSYFKIAILAGETDIDFISERSTSAEHAVLLADEPPAELGKFFAPVAGQDHPKPAPKATAENIVTRIMAKGERHRKAGRNGQFSQVMVPMEDYETLCQYFCVGEPPFDEVLVSTPVGIVSVYPVNPDGITFTD